MARQAALPQNLAPRIISREAAAAYVSVAPATFDAMVADGRMPRPRILSDRRRGWDLRELDLAVDRLPHSGQDSEGDTSWSDIDAEKTAGAR